MKIICIGRNYVDHAKELDNPIPSEPMFFLKPDSALLIKNKPFFYPDFSTEIHYEVELVVKISRLGKHIEERFAHRYYNEVGLGIDFTARDLQRKAKEKGHPWEIAKAFDQSAVLGRDFLPLEDLGAIQNINFSLERNGEIVQNGNSKDMIFSVDKLVAYVSKFMTLKIGDIIYTGTPAGVGQVAIGDRLTGKINDKAMFDFLVK